MERGGREITKETIYKDTEGLQKDLTRQTSRFLQSSFPVLKAAILVPRYTLLLNLLEVMGSQAPPFPVSALSAPLKAHAFGQPCGAGGLDGHTGLVASLLTQLVRTEGLGQLDLPIHEGLPPSALQPPTRSWS